MNDKHLTMEQHSENLSNLSSSWLQIQWTKVEKTVKRLQTRIAKATKEKRWNKVKRLSYLLAHSHSAKLLAVRTVTTNRGKRTPGVDNVLWATAESKMEAALSLTDKRYHAKPLRRVLIEKKGKTTKRPLSIPCMCDRAMQALYAIVLQPIAETIGDTHSFGFRIGRCAQDVLGYIFTILSNKYSPVWILEGDIKGCFDHISHDWLIKNIPMDKSVLKQFLKAGYVYEDKLFSTNEGTPQGGIISPILANMALDGIQKLLSDNFKGKKVNFARYADDFIVTAETKEVAEQAKELIRDFLKQRGLELSEEKTVITHINDGFDFLGWNFRKYNGTLIIKPSKKSIGNLLDKLSKVIKYGAAHSQDELIKSLNPILRGWTNYHKCSCAKKVFSAIGHELFLKLARWAQHRHHNKSRKWIYDKYWHSEKGRDWVFKTDKEELFNVASVPIRRHTYLNSNMNPFLNQEYFMKRFTKSENFSKS